MQNVIQKLPHDLAEKIAAGEVIERPASVIKELVENAIDAQATNIEVQILEGGKRKISVTDNGIGIRDDQVQLALERHATSKLKTLDDLWNIQTMGFRGEALPSIATVSRFTLEARAKQQKGVALYLEGGTLKKTNSILGQSPLGTQTGTRVLCESLFYNVPARLKFLKSKSAESSFIRENLERIALAHPKIRFTLISENRKTFDVPANQTSNERVASVFKINVEDLETFNTQYEEFKIQGWLDRNSRATNSKQLYFSVNGRMVKDRLLQQAVLVALRPRMMEGEYPKIYLDLTIPSYEIDVNVHPAKTEIRFRNARDVFQLIHGMLDKVAVRPSRAFYSAPLKSAEQPTPLFNTGTSFRVKENQPWDKPTSHEHSIAGSFNTSAHLSQNSSGSLGGAPSDTPGFENLHYIGQLKNTYLLFQDQDGLVVVDQHAAHERIQYESIKKTFLRDGFKPQPLLMSMSIKCTPETLAMALENQSLFLELGFQMEEFGDSCLILRAIPEGLEPKIAKELFHTLLEELQNPDSQSTPDALTTLIQDPTRLNAKVERLLATGACHSSVRAGQTLSPLEAKSLAKQMDVTDSSLNCPHGRPTSIRLKYSQIEGLFKRV